MALACCVRLGLGWVPMVVLLTGIASTQAQGASYSVSTGEVAECCGESPAAARTVLQGMLQFVEPGSDLEAEITLLLDLIEDGVDPETLKDDLLAVQEEFLEQSKGQSDLAIVGCRQPDDTCGCSGKLSLCFNLSDICIGFCIIPYEISSIEVTPAEPLTALFAIVALVGVMAVSLVKTHPNSRQSNHEYRSRNTSS